LSKLWRRVLVSLVVPSPQRPYLLLLIPLGVGELAPVSIRCSSATFLHAYPFFPALPACSQSRPYPPFPSATPHHSLLNLDSIAYREHRLTPRWVEAVRKGAERAYSVLCAVADEVVDDELGAGCGRGTEGEAKDGRAWAVF
jgi:hypothetical protein